MTSSTAVKQNPPPGGGSKKIPNEPLYGFVPRMVTAKQVRVALVREDLRDANEELTKAQDGDVNPFTKRPYTAQYKKILDSRKNLPVYVQMTEFYEMVSVPPRSEVYEGRSEPASEPLKKSCDGANTLESSPKTR